MHVKLTFQGFSIPLPDWFRIGHNCTVNRFSMLENFVSHIKNRSDSFSTLLSELNSIQNYKPQGRPKFSSSMIHYALLLHPGNNKQRMPLTLTIINNSCYGMLFFRKVFFQHFKNSLLYTMPKQYNTSNMLGNVVVRNA